jgi:chorismate mutase
MAVRALRGATTVERDDAGEIAEATAELLEAMLERNGVQAAAIVSIMFTATPDLTSGFPAVGARRLGLDQVPLLCATEMAVKGAPERCIRVLVHLETDRDYGSLRHVYLRGASSLRTDLQQ